MSTSHQQEKAAETKKWVLSLSEKEVMTQIEQVTDDEVTTLVGDTESVASSSISVTTFAMFEFQGFDPRKVIKKIIVLGRAHKLQPEDLKRDIMFMIAANLYMGNLSGKALMRRSTEGVELIDELSTKYSVQTGTTSTGLPSDALTYPRIANSFPVLTCRMATQLPSKDLVGKAFKSMTIPRFMRVGAFASFCKRDMDPKLRLFLLEAVASYSCDQSIVFEEGRLKKLKKTGKDLEVDPTTVAGEQWTYVQAASDSPLPEKSVCASVLTEFNILGHLDKLIPVVENYRKLTGSSEPLPSKSDLATMFSEFITNM